ARWSSGFDAVATADDFNYSMLHTTGYARTSTGVSVHQGIGSFSLNFGSSNKANLNITYPAPPGGSWIRSNVTISRLAQ
ncbi:MAG: hypothetical protein JKX98_09255, partial [Alcanivoracaceae bacterium]|nr:hypothetical protein [Alcanivoracaceae bacterium]